MSKKQYSANVKFRVALDACKGELTISELSSKHQVAPSVISKWKKILKDQGSVIFDHGYKSPDKQIEFERDQLLKKVGQLSMEIEFLKKAYERI
ncbi:transposase [Corynebacterium parakroppenstedtii]|uniref:transposase n=1 Tax=Corynebacterium parakroppenstedtii TaxID=2828363 RepID=UPI001EF09094|nr:transposase [Corynebacterium parakroppenstedtii]MCF7184050.1 transposase [Corynebacterium parakroppenstedtii]MCF8713060.1 transposase [Corynebacterium parakroppenstedtii]